MSPAFCRGQWERDGIMVEKTLRMEKNVIDCYKNEDLDVVTKLDIIVNLVEGYVAEYMQIVVCHLQDARER